ncbi:jg2445 [Pararge aegeria aegeria]|uniref:Jg2445 protein n=1 Tax=Pararge aegeria aegeria TaxID=348720 RepID=A0A8S4RVP9_9NEOP|nr:jg2445 [Pararge aegeria aegeria]
MRDVSSANSTMSQVPLTWCGRSFIYTRNNKGPKIEPCGTPIKNCLFSLISIHYTNRHADKRPYSHYAR